MKRFQFQLDPVLRLRTQAKQLAELGQAQAMSHLLDARRRLAGLETELREVCEAGTAPVHVPLCVNPLLQLQPTVGALERRIAVARNQVRAAELQYERAAATVKELAIQVESLETLKQSRRDDHRDEVNRQIQVQLDETVMRRWDRRGSTAGRDDG